MDASAPHHQISTRYQTAVPCPSCDLGLCIRHVPEPDSAPTISRPFDSWTLLGYYGSTTSFGSFASRLFLCYKKEPHQSVDHGERTHRSIKQSSVIPFHQTACRFASGHGPFVKRLLDFLGSTDDTHLTCSRLLASTGQLVYVAWLAPPL